MTILVTQPIETELSQEVRFNLNTRCQIGAFIPYLYMGNAPAGVFTFEVYSFNQDEVIFSKDFTSNDIKAALETTRNYAHVFYPIVPENPVQIEKGLFKFTIRATGYTPTNSNYLGWIQQFEDIQNEMNYVPLTDEQNSLAFRIKEYKEGVQ